MTAAPDHLEEEIRSLLAARFFIEKSKNQYQRRIAKTGTHRIYRIVFLPADGNRPAMLDIYDGKNKASIEISAAGGPRAAVSQAIDLIANSSRLAPPWSYAFGRS